MPHTSKEVIKMAITDMYDGGKVHYMRENGEWYTCPFSTFKDACDCVRLLASVAGFKKCFVSTYNAYYDMFEDFDVEQVFQWYYYWFPRD